MGPLALAGRILFTAMLAGRDSIATQFAQRRRTIPLVPA
jgi:hypothetical protein